MSLPLLPSILLKPYSIEDLFRILRVPDAETELVHDVVDQLHDLFRNMSCTDGDPESSGATQNSSSAANGGSVPRDPIAPNSFLQVNCSFATGGGVIIKLLAKCAAV